MLSKNFRHDFLFQKHLTQIFESWYGGVWTLNIFGWFSIVVANI